MLSPFVSCLTRRIGETVRIAGDILVTIIEVKGNQIHLGIEHHRLAIVDKRGGVARPIRSGMALELAANPHNPDDPRATRIETHGAISATFPSTITDRSGVCFKPVHR